MDAEKIWHIHVDQTYGPFSHAEVLELLKTKQIQADTNLWREGMAEWLPLSAIPEFQPKRPANAAVATPSPVNSASPTPGRSALPRQLSKRSSGTQTGIMAENTRTVTMVARSDPNRTETAESPRSRRDEAGSGKLLNGFLTGITEFLGALSGLVPSGFGERMKSSPLILFTVVFAVIALLLNLFFMYG